MHEPDRVEDAGPKQGPADPVPDTPPRAPGSVRRTSTIDTTRPDGLFGRLVVDGRARDVRTAPDGTAEVVAEATMQLDIGVDRALTAITTTPAQGALDELVGAHVGRGYRKRIDGLVPELADGAPPLYLLLDDTPGAVLVSGYALQRGEALRDVPLGDEFLVAQGDLCAGWALDGSMMTVIRETGRHPISYGPAMPSLVRADDPDAWHSTAELPLHATRRRRRLDLLPASPDAPGLHRVDVHFRDTYLGVDGIESGVHEYRVTATVDARTRTIVAIDAAAHVLPWTECPAATASATRIVGAPIATLRAHVRETFVGTTTCTHLNDVLRSLTDVDALLELVTT